MQPVTITLEGKDYAVRPLTLGQVEDLRIALVEALPDNEQEQVRWEYRRNLGVIAAALSTDHPDVTVGTLKNMRATRDEVSAAVDKIIELSGLKPKEPASGEALPAQAPA
jgi:hypothetical protein